MACLLEGTALGVGRNTGIFTASWTVISIAKNIAAVVIVTMSQNDTINISGSPFFLRLAMAHSVYFDTASAFCASSQSTLYSGSMASYPTSIGRFPIIVRTVR